jgi:uncharacterized protein DUF4235
MNPFSILSLGLGLAAGQLAKKVFTFVWDKVDDEQAPDFKHREVPYVKLVIALLVEGAIFKLVKGMVDHGARHAWARSTGAWPGPERPEDEE